MPRRRGQMLYRMSSHLLSGSPELLTTLVDGMRERQELPRCSDPCNLVRLAFFLQSVVDGADAWVEARRAGR
jgi:hypothetical protein